MVDTVKTVPFSVETVKMSCNVISSMDFVIMVVHLAGWVIDVTKVGLMSKNVLHFQISRV